MAIFLLILAAVCLYKTKIILRPDGYNSHYMDFDRTTSMKGVFIFLVFLSHANNYFTGQTEYISDILNKPYCIIQNHLGQLIVVMFLIYSGYGVMESIRKKGESYVNAIPVKRVFKTLYHFDMAVVLFFILGIAFGDFSNWNLSKILLSFIGWDSLGNSNWYIFEVLTLYLITFISFKISKMNTKLALCIVTILSFAYIAVMSRFKEPWWFDTVMCYSVGMWFSFYKNRIEAFLHRKAANYFIALAISLIVFAVCHIFRGNIILYELSVIFFGITVVLLTMKLDLNNKILFFFGKHLFEIYILMRIPMQTLIKLGVSNVYLFVIISFAVTLMLSLPFKKVLEFTDRKIIKL